MRRQVTMFFIIICSFSLYAKDTILKLYRPFGAASGQVPLVITEKRLGKCWQQSHYIKREDAWRCIAKKQTFDPCFIRQYGTHKEALCKESPWIGASILLELAEPVDNSQHTPLDLSKAYPWAIELTTGEKCLATDSGGTIEGLPINYHCDNQHVLIGHLQRCSTEWSILQSAREQGIETVNIAKAWF